MADFRITAEWIEELLELASMAEQIEFLRSAGAADEMGVEDLLDYTEEISRHQPHQAQTLTHICEEAAHQISAAALVPRAIYLRAQTHVLGSEPQAALGLIQSAREQFTTLNMAADALRTDIGLMNTLAMMGNYTQALKTGKDALAQIDTALEDANTELTKALKWMQATIHVTMGPALSESGRFEEALSAYAQSEAIFIALQSINDLALVLNNRGVALRYLGRVSEALADYERAAELLPGSGYFYALIQTNIGDAQILLGDYQAGLSAYEEAKEQLTVEGLEADRHICTGHIADTYLALNLYPEAMTLYQEVVEGLRLTEFRYYRGKALWGLAIAQRAVGDFTDAVSTLTQAADIFVQLDNSPLQLSVLLEQVAILAEQGENQPAFTLMEQVFSRLRAGESGAWPVQQVYAHLRMADLHLPNVVEAETHLDQADLILQNLSLPHLRYRLWQRQGHIRRLQHRREESQELLESAISEIERLRSSLATEAFRISFQQDKMDAYEELIQLYLEQTDLEETEPGEVRLERSREAAIERTFDLIERAKSRALVERMSGVVGAFVNEQSDQESTALHQIQARLNAIYSELLGQESGDSDEPETRGERSARMVQLNQQASLLENELAQLRLQEGTEARIGQAAPSSHSMPQIQQQLTDDTIIVSYHVVGEEILAFVITKQNAQVIRHISTSTQIEPLLIRLNSQWGHFRGRQAFIERHLSRLEQNAQLLLHQLDQALMAPLGPLLSLRPSFTGQETGGPRLVIVPHGVLHQVPFQALFDGTHYLIERATLSYAPSVTVYALCQEKKLRPSGNVLALAASDPAIPAVEAESIAISQTVQNATILLNEEATIDRLRQSIPGKRIVHFACHGLYREDNPMFSALCLYDGWLTATNLSQLDLSCIMVVLSACESGRGVILAGDEMMGLARACLSAGASGLIVSQWLVQDDTGAMLMAEWYARIARGQNAAEALQAAQVSIKSSHPHPYYWAPFILMGNGDSLF